MTAPTAAPVLPAPPAQLRLVPAGDRPGAVDVDRLYRRMRGPVLGLVTRSVDAPEQVIEDACQVAWIRLARYVDRVEPALVLGWLIRTATREARRQLRREWRELSLEAALERDDDDEGDPIVDAETGVVHLRPVIGVAEQWEARARIDSVRELPERQSRIVWLHAAGLTYEEIGRVTGDTPRTVQRQLLRGRARLRELAA